jgi:hypothetical protein
MLLLPLPMLPLSATETRKLLLLFNNIPPGRVLKAIEQTTPGFAQTQEPKTIL